jgi:putative GTP pyrophosphokinase
MRMATTSKLLADFDLAGDIYARYADKLEGLVAEILLAEDVNYHSVTSRPKARASLEKKILIADGKYDELNEITDCVGVRIITYFEDDVDRIASIITKEFDIDVQNSVDKRDLLDPDRFGYLSLHYVASLPAIRSNLLEYRRFGGMKAEIQIRSILQHAWAEIEHDLGYKTTLGVPRDIRRQFSRLAGLLELADVEFIHIRNRLAEYEATLAKRIQQSPTAVTIDKASLSTFVRTSELITTYDFQIASIIDVSIEDTTEQGIEKYAALLQTVGLNTIGQVQETLKVEGDRVVALARQLLLNREGEPLTSVFRAVSLLYLCYVMMLQRDDEVTTNAVLAAVAGEDSLRARVLERLRAAYSASTLE